MVVKTLSGMAQALASAVDSMKLQGILGSVAGDNTLILVLREGAEHKAVLDVLSKLFPALGR